VRNVWIFLLSFLLGVFMRLGPTAVNYPARAGLMASDGYGAIHVNQNAYRWNNISSVNLSGTIYQAACYWDSDGTLRIGKRVLDGSWTFYDIGIVVNGDDNHDVITLGLDPDGYIHFAYGMHADSLLYRKSDAPISSWTGGVTAVLSMLGTNETAVTYPTWLNDPAGNLYFIFRDGVAGNGDMYMYKYNHATTTWAGVAGTTAGKVINGKGESYSPYWEHPSFDADFGSGGYFHLAFHWVDVSGTGRNFDKSYVKWDGTNWVKSNGNSQTIPITNANAEIIDDVGAYDTGMTSFNGLYSDSNGNPHIIYPKTVGGFRRLVHAYHNGTSWSISQINTTNGFGTDVSVGQIGLNVVILIDRASDTIYVLYRDSWRGSGISLLKSTDFVNWTEKIVYPYDVGWALPHVDENEFVHSGNIYLMIEEYHGALLSGSQATFPIYLWKVDPTIW